MAAKFPYYLLADSEAGAAQEQKITGVKPDAPFTNDIKRRRESVAAPTLEAPDPSSDSPAQTDGVAFETMILDNLRKAGVQNTFKAERLTFDASVGERAKEFAPSTDGFAETAEERKLGRLRVLLAGVNPDLAMGDKLLKKTGTGNLFMVFGEPDVELRRLDGDQLEVEIHGVDVYDPTTGHVRSLSTDDIACWLVDTNYDDTSFFARHAYFTGRQQPYDSLAKTLRADIDESAWATLYSTISRPFSVPATGKITVKVINHYGDEVMQVYDV